MTVVTTADTSQLYALAARHGLKLHGPLTVNELGLDYRIVIATVDDGRRWVLRIPRRAEVSASLVLTTQAQRAEEARTSSLSSSDSSRPLSASAFPDTLPGTEYGPDRGIRLSAVWLMHDPAYPESLPAAPLVRYTYTEAGELLAVYDRSNTQVRAFTYDAQHPGRMVAHRYAGRPEMRYRYDDTGRVVEQLNPAGLSYRYLYEQDRITVTDSLNRREVLHTEGGAGLKRVVKKELADGSVTRSGYDAAGTLLPFIANTSRHGKHWMTNWPTLSGLVMWMPETLTAASIAGQKSR